MNANLDRSSNVNHLHDAKANSSILPSVTVIGLGSMGSKLARTFLHSGYVTTVWNRTPEKAAELVGLVPPALRKSQMPSPPAPLDYMRTGL